MSRVQLGPVDRALLRAAWSLGWGSTATLAGLVVPDRGLPAVERRLRVLCTAGYLRALRLLFGPAGHRLLYAPGRLAARVDPGLAGGWRPALAAVEHTVAVGRVLLAGHAAGLAPPLVVTGWRGEAELRAWALPGEPLPDAALSWVAAGRRGEWLLEVDRGTEGRGQWERKLARYLDVPRHALVVVVAPCPARARRLAQLASGTGVPLVSLTAAEWLTPARGGAAAWSARHRCRLSLAAASADLSG